MSLKEPNSKLIRWRLKLEEYDYEIVYKKGKLNTNADALSRIKTHLPDNMNINAFETISNQATSGSTVHSALENFDDGIPISEKPINNFNLQALFRKGNFNPRMKVEVIFKNKHRKTFTYPNYTEELITEIFKNHLAPNKTTAIFTDDECFRIIQNVYAKHFAQSKIFRLVRCTEMVKDIKENDNQDKIIQDYHENNNHRGIQETYDHLKREYYFPYMKSKIIQTINNCIPCQRLKYDRHPPKNKFEKPPTPVKPLDILHIDVYTINGKTVLTIIDKFSKFAAAYTLTAKNSLCVIKSLKHFLSTHGIPNQIVCDQGTEFNSNIFKDFCQQYQINLHFTSFQQSSSNAAVERLHSTLTETYRLILEKLRDKKLEMDHEDILSEVIITYNNAIHSSTKLTPFELFYGRTYEFDRQIAFNNEHEYLSKINKFQTQLYESIRSKLEINTDKRIEKLNTGRQDPLDYEVDDYIYRKECRRNKITPRFSKHKVKQNDKATLLTTRNAKLHKSKMRKRRF